MNGTQLVLFRVLQGVGGSIVFALSLAILSQSFRGKRLAMVLGIWGAVVNLGLGCGPVIGGRLTEVSWRWIFFVNLPVGIAAVIMTLLGVQEYKAPHASRIDVLGSVAFAAGLVGLITALIEGNKGWGQPVVVIGFVVAFLAFTVFPLIERRASHPMLDMSLLRKPAFIGGLLAGFGMNCSIYAVMLYLVLYLQSGLHASALDTGFQLLVITVAAMLTSLLGGRLAARLSSRTLIPGGLALIGVGLVLMLGVSATSSWIDLVPGMLLAGAGSGFITSSLASVAVGVAPPEQVGMASGVNSAFRQIGMSVSVAVLGADFTGRLTSHPTPSTYADALNTVLVIATGLALGAAALTAVLIRPKDLLPS